MAFICIRAHKMHSNMSQIVNFIGYNISEWMKMKSMSRCDDAATESHLAHFHWLTTMNKAKLLLDSLGRFTTTENNLSVHRVWVRVRTRPSLQHYWPKIRIACFWCHKCALRINTIAKQPLIMHVHDLKLFNQLITCTRTHPSLRCTWLGLNLLGTSTNLNPVHCKPC